MAKLIEQLSDMKRLMGLKEIEMSLRGTDLYHGGGSQILSFDLAHQLEGTGLNTHGHGVYLTDNKNVAVRYALNSLGRKGYIHTVKVVNIENMLPWDADIEDSDANVILNRYTSLTDDEESVRDMQDNLGLSDDYYGNYPQTSSIYKHLSSILGSDEKASNFLLRCGFDGVVFRVNEAGLDGTNYTIFDPTNIKVLDTEYVEEPK